MYDRKVSVVAEFHCALCIHGTHKYLYMPKHKRDKRKREKSEYHHTIIQPRAKTNISQ